MPLPPYNFQNTDIERISKLLTNEYTGDSAIIDLLNLIYRSNHPDTAEAFQTTYANLATDIKTRLDAIYTLYPFALIKNYTVTFIGSSNFVVTIVYAKNN